MDMENLRMNAVRLYRCDTCSKWSHAQKKPKHHQRFISAEDHPEGPGPFEVIREEEEAYGLGPDDSYYAGGWWVKCGPFIAYDALPAQA